MFKLDELAKAGKKRKRIGRGGARGGSSGRGFGGQKARTGSDLSPLFEGGQMPLIRRLPKRGFSNARFASVCEIVNLEQLENRFQDNAVVTYDLLCATGLVKPKNKTINVAHIKILGRGGLTKKLTVHAHKFSAQAKTAIELVGGQVVLINEENTSK